MKNILFLICTLFVFVAAIAPVTANSYAGYEYLYPKPDAGQVPQHATVMLRFDDVQPEEIDSIQHLVRVYDRNGIPYPGTVKMASDGQTIIFKPDVPFAAGDRVRVVVSPGGQNVIPVSYSFNVTGNELPVTYPADPPTALQKPVKVMDQPQIMPNGVSVPSDFPHVDVLVNDAPADGYIFINNWGKTNYNMMLEPDGSPYWYQKMPDERRDMKIQKNGLLTMLVRQGYDFGQGFIGLDKTFTEVATYHAVAGCGTDEHELQVLENGHYLLIGTRSFKVDMRPIVPGGKKDARVSESGIQEFTPDGDLIFHWRAWDNFDPKDMIGFSDDQPTDQSFRFPHMNSIDIDDDGHIILSSKRLSEVTKIHRRTGDIIWRLGGANNQFTFVGDPLNGFSMQHSARVLGDGHYTIFDNGVFHGPPLSRALEYKLDTSKMTATLVWSYRRQKKPVYAFHMGNVQRLPNGNTLINWAVQDMPKAQEIRPDGSIAYEMNFVDRFKTYRTFKFSWDGKVATPHLVVEPQIDNVTLLFNKFGDKNVDFYNIYAGKRKNPTEIIATSRKTLLRLYELDNNTTYYFRVTAVDKDGTESGFSNQEQVFVNMFSSGEDMVDNGDFSGGKQSWDWLVRNGAQASWSVDDNTARINISNGGNNDHDIQLTQPGIMLVEGREYLFEFAAWADESRPVEAKIAQNGDAYTNYSRIGLTALARNRKHYDYQFVMQDPTDADARIVFNMGGNTANVYIKDVSVTMVGTTDTVDRTDSFPDAFELVGNYPNPFNPKTTIQYSVAEKQHVVLKIYNLAGHEVATLVDAPKTPGEHRTVWHGLDANGRSVSSGVYFCRLSNGRRVYHQKMLLVK